MPGRGAIAVCALLGVSLVGQTKLPPGTGVISGRVVDGASGRGWPGLPVSLNIVAENASALPMEPSTAVAAFPAWGPYSDRTSTDANGVFTFVKVPAGSFEITAVRPGTWYDLHREGVERRWYTIQDGQRLTGLELKVPGLARIAGRVVDDRGTPLTGIEMLATPLGKDPRSRDINRVITDDRGRYALHVQPGEYIVSTNQFPSMSDTRGFAPGSAFVQMFFPNVPAMASASAIRLAADEARDDVDFTLAMRRVFRITGSLGGVPSTRLTVIDLRPEAAIDPRAEPLVDTGLGVNQSAFAFTGVPPGRYILHAISTPNVPTGSHGIPPLEKLPPEPTLWARVPVVVDDRDVAVDLNLQPGARMHGRVVFDGTAPVPPVEGFSDRSFPMLLIAERADGAKTDFRGARSTDGRFSTIQIEPGRYVFNARAQLPWRVSSIILNGRDIRDHPFDMGSADIHDVVITMTDRRSAIGGRVTREPPYESTRGWVTIFPSDRSLWSNYGDMPRRIAFVELGRSGEFEVEVPPGSYLAAATPQSTRGRISAETLSRLATFATSIVVGDGQTIRADLRLRERNR